MSERYDPSPAIPGPQSARLGALLHAYESRNVTYLADDFPVFWESALGALVVDVDGNEFVDLTSAFGVANLGHADPYVAAAIADQAGRLMHGMGDVHPTEVRARLLERLARIVPTGLSKTFLATTGSEAVEAALKTAALASGKSGVAAFRNAYHGLSLGALRVCGIEKFVAPFRDSIGPPALWLDFPRRGIDACEASLDRIRQRLRAADDLGALIVEPIQGRAGVVIPPDGFLAGLRRICDEVGAVMIVDEIYTGFGRTGAMFASQAEDVVPDILCIGKALGAGFPISAAVARPAIMDAWPASPGEALHTSTFLGNPMGCAAALACIEEIERHNLPARARALGEILAARLRALPSHPNVVEVRGRGALWAIGMSSAAAAEATVKGALARGVIVVQCGIDGDAVAIVPPLIVDEDLLMGAIDALEAAIVACA